MDWGIGVRLTLLEELGSGFFSQLHTARRFLKSHPSGLLVNSPIQRTTYTTIRHEDATIASNSRPSYRHRRSSRSTGFGFFRSGYEYSTGSNANAVSQRAAWSS